MFKSVSRAIPKTQQTTSFVASRAMTIDVVSFNDFYITVNGVQASNYQNIAVSIGDTVTAVVTSPDDFLWYKFLYYKIDNVPQSFAVVNKSEYTSRVRSADAIKRWYLYDPDVHKFTFRTSSGGFDIVEFGTSANNLYGKYHIVLEPISNSVGFFSPINHFISRVTLPAQPIDYAVNPIRDTLLVLVRSGEVYEIFLNSRAEGLAPFLSLRNYSEFTGDLSYLTRLPGEDLITFLRRLRNKLAIPPATCMTTVGNFLVAGGNGTVWIVNLGLGFVLTNTFAIDEYILDIVTLPDSSGVLVVTQSQKVYTITMTGNMQQIYQGSSLWQPAVFNGKIYIPECNIEGDRSPTSFTNEGRLLVYNPTTQLFESPINLPEFCPSYITVGSGKMYVCGHDTERVFEFNSNLQYSIISFSDKVTWVSECEGSLMASHFLSAYKILIAPDLFRIIEVDFRPRTGPVSYIGTNIETVKLLGSEEVVARTPNDTWIWANGRRTESNSSQGVTLVEGDFISLSYAARVPGTSRTNCVIGDTAYDYDITAVAQTYYARHIDLPVQTVGDFGIHSRQITLPRFFTPCLMSLEYGTLLVNGAFYYGDRLVYPEDTIEIRILAGKTAQEINSVLPIFTIGARQYVIPVAKSLLIPTQTFVDDNLVPGTSLVKTVTITALSDFIIPGYYDLIIKKNNINITGNYYQQFGLNDTLVIEFTSSRKRYDERDVYILGTPNYRFNAKNIIENKIGYLNFGNIQNPFPRLFHPEATTQTVNLGSGYSIANYYDLKQYQFLTANIAITGLAVGTTGNLSHNGIDTFFVHNGEVILGTNEVEVELADNIALCRNINNFFEQTITVTQLLPDPEDDFFVDVEVGRWGVINQTILQPPNIYYQSFSVHEKTEIIRSKNVDLLADKNQLSLNRIYYFNTESPKLVLSSDTYALDSYIYTKFAPNQRKIFSAIESLDKIHLLDTSSMKAFVEHSNGSNATKFELKAIKGQVVLASRIGNELLSKNSTETQKYNWQADSIDFSLATIDSQFFRRNVVLDDYSLAEKDRSKNRKIFYALEMLDKNNLLPTPSYKAAYRSNPVHEIKQFDGQHSKLPPAIKIFSAAEHYEFNSFRVDAAKFEEFSVNENSYFVQTSSPIQSRHNPLREKFADAVILEWEEKTNEIYLGAKSTVGLTRVKVFEPVVYFNRDKKSLAYSAQQHKYNYGTYEFLLPIAQVTNVIFSPESIWQHNVLAEKYNKTYSPNITNINYADNQQNYKLGTYNYSENSQYTANKTEIEYTGNRQYYESRDRKYASGIQQYQYQVTDNDLTYFGVDVTYETRDRKYATEQISYQLTDRNYANNGQLFEITENNYTENQQYYEIRLSNLADRVLSRSQKIVFADPSLVESSFSRLEKLTFAENEMSSQRLDSINFTPSIVKPIQLKVADKLKKYVDAEAGISLKQLIDMSYVNELRGLEIRNSARYKNELQGLGGLKAAEYVNEIRPIEIISSLSYQNTRALEIPVRMNYTYEILGPGSQYRINFVTDQLNVGAPVDMEFLQTEYINTATSESKFTITRDNPGSTVKEEFLRMQMGRESLEYPHKWNIGIQRDGFADQSKFTIVDFVVFSSILSRPVQSGRQMIGQVLPGNAVLLQDKDRLILSLPPETKTTNLSLSAAPTVYLDKELVWNNDIEVRYGAFATEEDAILAAQIYTEFRPFLILNTNLWTYRVLLDTNLVCPLPPGRYPIAWLIRGG